MRTWGTPLVIAATIALTGCSAATSAPTPTETAASSFLDDMRATDAFFGFSDDQLEEIGQDICAALEDGSTFDDLVRILSITDYSEDEASAIIFASSREYCPQDEK